MIGSFVRAGIGLILLTALLAFAAVQFGVPAFLEAAQSRWMTQTRLEQQVCASPVVSPEIQVFNLLRSESLSFLVTERLTSQITVDVDESSLWLGCSSGSLTGVVRMYYGVDLSRLTQGDVRQEGEACVVFLPEPEVLDFAVDVASLRFLTKRSILQVLGDNFTDHDLRTDLQSRFKAASQSFFREQSLLPDRAALCARLNQHTQSWADRVGVPVSFR